MAPSDVVTINRVITLSTPRLGGNKCTPTAQVAGGVVVEGSD